MIKEFNINYKQKIESGEYDVVTRQGVPVRIVCWDRKNFDGYSIIALVKGNYKEEVVLLTNKGKYYLTKLQSRYDIFVKL